MFVIPAEGSRHLPHTVIPAKAGIALAVVVPSQELSSAFGT